MTVKLLTEHHLEFLSLKGGCKGSFESTLVKMNCWKSYDTAQFSFCFAHQAEEEVILRSAAPARAETTKIMSMEPSDDEDETQMGTGTGTGSGSFSRSFRSTIG